MSHYRTQLRLWGRAGEKNTTVMEGEILYESTFKLELNLNGTSDSKELHMTHTKYII